jgi:PAS domain S-box-containing protein
VLRKEGFTVVDAYTGEQALALVRREAPALVLLDIRLPDISGLEVCRRIKSDPATARTLVLHVSAACVDSAARGEALMNGADGYLSEPVEPIELVAQVRTLLRLARAETAAHEAGRRLQRQLQELEATYASAPIGLCVLDTDLRWVRLNERMAAMNGLPAEAHIGKTPRELLPDLAAQAEAALREILRTGQALPAFEICGETPAEPGVVRWWNERWAPIKDARGTVLGIAVATEDITDWKRAEAALAAALESAERREAEIATIYDAAPVGLCVVDREGRYVRINRRLAEINGLSTEAHIGRTIGEIVPGLANEAEALLRRVLETEAPVVGAEISGEVPSRPGMVRTWIEHLFPLRGPSGEVEGVNVAVEEITHLKQVEEALREANRAKDDFLATLSHELRTPLNAILGWSQMLAARQLDREALPKVAQVILRNAQTQSRLINDVLDVSRMISGKLRLEIRPLDLIPVLAQALESVQPVADARRLTVTSRLEVETAIVRADPVRLQQALWNVLLNAVKFTPSDGRIDIRVAADDSTVRVIVRDTGIGIAPEFLPRVFDRFVQADASTSRRHAGLGLGLSIVRHLVELHGGSVTAASEGEGRGATFALSLPLHPENDVSNLRDVRRVSEGHPAVAGTRVLVLDDDEDGRHVLGAMLEHHGCEVLLSSSAEEALTQVPLFRPHVILADIAMPSVDGHEFLRRLRLLPPDRGGATPVGAVSAYGSLADRRRALASGFDGYEAKPVLEESLLDFVARLIARTADRSRHPTDHSA